MFDKSPEYTHSPVAGFEPILTATAQRIAPLWPLKSFVAVNPYVGYADMLVGDAMARLNQTAGARHTMAHSYYIEAIADGTILDCDIEAAAAACKVKTSVEALKLALWWGRSAPDAPEKLLTVCDLATDKTDFDWSALTVDYISKFAAMYFDQGQATVRAIAPGQSLWRAWQNYAQHDLSLDAMGVIGARQLLKSLPSDRLDAARMMLETLWSNIKGLPLYFECLLYSVGGWAAYARQMGWSHELDGGAVSPFVEDLILIRLTCDWLAYVSSKGTLLPYWLTTGSTFYGIESVRAQATIASVFQEALEISSRRSLARRFSDKQDRISASSSEVQAAFCIDVRSEIVRRAFEAVVPKSETLGFAGFFGFAVEVTPLASETSQAQCPVLLKPTHRVKEESQSVSALLRREKARVLRAYKRFKNSAIGSFAFVDMFGLAYGARLVSDTLGLTAPAPRAGRFGIKARSAVRPALEKAALPCGDYGFSSDERIDMAETVLRSMSLTQHFAPTIMLVGHGSTSRNNPHAAGLDCGACGGHSGESNARVAAQILNDDTVRHALRARDIIIPDTTRFYGAVHDTVSDDITIFEDGTLTSDEAQRLKVLRRQLADVAKISCRERAPLMHVQSESDHSTVLAARSLDWAQVRPEWGLAGCTSFVAAPRNRTHQHSLKGRTFLHSYDWHKDDDFSVLELIMTAPMVVASWINLQYYASTIDNAIFGAGDKTLHNVVGRTGVLEGQGGDVRVGLAKQSVHDGERYVHTPVRLTVVLEAPQEAMNSIIRHHKHVRDLLDNKWIYLLQMDESGTISHSYAGDLTWQPVALPAEPPLSLETTA